MYPLRFRPIFREYLWGGRRLETVLGKSLGEGDCYAESWEIVDHGDDQSVVLAGDWKGRTLGDLVAEFPLPIVGRQAPSFPLLFKFLDAQQPLSVQVHPNDAQAARLDPPDLGKTEAWVVLDCEPDSVIYAGLRSGVDRAMFAQHIERGTTEACLHTIHPRVGDCIFIPAGVVHAIGAGIVIAEIQQASDTTFRVFDWNRLDANGHSRTLHIEQAMEVIDFEKGPSHPIRPAPSPGAQSLVSCDKFSIVRQALDGPETIGGDGRFHIIAVLEGSLQLEGDPIGEPLSKGQTCLLPAGLGATKLHTHSALFLDMS